MKQRLYEENKYYINIFIQDDHNFHELRTKPQLLMNLESEKIYLLEENGWKEIKK
jgi:hypothetical protein